MTVRLTDDVEWINECYEFEETGKHEHVSVYLIQEGDRYILIDSGSFYHRDAIKSQLEEATGNGLDAIILSHSDYPHAGNIDAFREEWGEVDLIASSGAPKYQGLSNARKCTIGESMEVLGRKFSFIDPPLADRSHTTWIYDHGSHILFTADGFCNHHDPGECDFTSADFKDGIGFEDIYECHKETLVWLRYVDPRKLRSALESILDRYETSYVASIHGNPIESTDLGEYMDKLTEAAEKISNEYEGI
ncbi:MAG: MBL fold metallo-hydrolase [Halobacteria archaeon]|nr:MBL fold metallo-hydrolase [Halobacteria archaeon]